MSDGECNIPSPKIRTKEASTLIKDILMILWILFIEKEQLKQYNEIKGEMQTLIMNFVGYITKEAWHVPIKMTQIQFIFIESGQNL